ncbi:glutathione-disulfide reductase [Lichtheimia corymbifera JMRC:FSU:9682]|uniref:Glutathione reductase n=1 Tax=Lichtheimia corymbifera JMRC:FSU:9682 TaxID=1263082 RepID=A0A068RHM8_9FUNG|nr:glutathione-disulfide reductase [Lichtheimia corymbifera JMRC:FSU:9682]
MPVTRRPSKAIYDFIVIGGGSGGIATARRAANLYSARVALVEMHSVLGGTCVNVGCVPKKIMWNVATFAETIREAASCGFKTVEPIADWNAIKHKRDAYIRHLNGIYERNLDKANVEHIHGHAEFVDDHTILVRENPDDTGGHAVIPNVPGAELGIDSDGFFALEHQPKRVAVVGTGYIGIELAGIFQALGSQVTVFSRTKKILRKFDPIVHENMMNEMSKSGIRFITDSSVKGLYRTDSGAICVDYGGEGIDVDCVIWAVGRKPNIQNLKLEKANVKVDAKGFIQVDKYQNTSQQGIYAVGDCCGKFELTPVAIAAGRKLADRLFGSAPCFLEYENIPTVIFGHPTAGSIGLTEEEARKEYGDSIKVYQTQFTNLYYALLDHKQATAFKLIVQGPQEKVVGLHLFGRGADEMLQGFGVAIRMGATKADFDNCVAIHPTSAEELVTLV